MVLVAFIALCLLCGGCCCLLVLAPSVVVAVSLLVFGWWLVALVSCDGYLIYWLTWLLNLVLLICGCCL